MSDQPDPKDYRDLRAFLEARVRWALLEQRARQVPRGILGPPARLAPRAPRVIRAQQEQRALLVRRD